MGLFGRKKKKEVVILQGDSAASDGKRGRRRRRPWVFWGVLVSFLCAATFSSFYDVFQSNAEKYMTNPFESGENIRWLYQSCYLLYRDLVNSQQESYVDYADLYLETEEGWQWTREKKQIQSYLTLLYAAEDYLSTEEIETAEGNQGADWLKDLLTEEGADTGWLQDMVTQGHLEEAWVKDFLAEESGGYSLTKAECEQLLKELNAAEEYFQSLEDSFRNLNSSYDYYMEDSTTGNFVTNMSTEDRNRSREDRYFTLTFTFDNAGNASVGDTIEGNDESMIRKYANEAIRENTLQNDVAGSSSIFGRHGSVKAPANCTITFEISRQAFVESGEGSDTARVVISSSYGNYDYYVVSSGMYGRVHSAYVEAGVGGILLLVMAGMVLLGMFLPLLRGTRPWKEEPVCRASFEVLFVLGCFICGVAGSYIMKMVAYVASGRAGGAFAKHLDASAEDAGALVMCLNLFVLTLFFFACWYIGICARALLELGMKEYIKHRSLIYRFFPFMKSRLIRIYQAASHLDLTRDAHKAIIKILVINAAILFFISCLWFGGLGITIAYSVILYFILRRYVSELQTRYRILLKAVDEIAQGRLNVTINEDLGVFEPFREQVFKIQDGLKKAVDMEVKSQRMKAELVTNMSHDLKTPLTAIITYANLLKEENLTTEQRREYVDTLERKALRLKSLIDDLFEFSKANSENITLNIMDVDIMNLLKQVAFEMSDKTQAAELDVRMNLTEERVILPLDSQKTYRIYENLFGNIAKYALHGTRVYVNGFRIDDMVVITLKNISAQEITVDASELTERFVRGDASRNTEGSGLGLAIAKSFTELQGGQLALEVDGDLFKVTTTWHIPASLPGKE